MNDNDQLTVGHIVQQLSWLPLPPDQIREELIFRGRKPADYENWNIDKLLALAFDEINQYAKGKTGNVMYDGTEFSASLRDKNFTKRFYHLEPTLANMDRFLSDEMERPASLWRQNVKAAKRLLLKMLSEVRGLKPLSTVSSKDVMSIFGDVNTSVGFGARGSKCKNEDYIFKTLQIMKERVANREIPLSETWIPAVVFHRAQISGYVDSEGHYSPDTIEDKDRMVLGIDGATVAFEGQYARPVYEKFVKLWNVYSGGKSPDEQRFEILRSREVMPYWYQLDFSKFDQSIQSWLIADCFDIMKTWFPKWCEREISWIAHNFIHTHVWMPGGFMQQKHRGIPSGSYFTQIIGTMCNVYMLLTYLCSTFEGSIDDKVWRVESMLSRRPGSICIQALGDDSILFTTMPVDLQDMESYLWKVFGVKISASKSVTSKVQYSPHYLKRDWTSAGEWRDPLELVIALCHPEYWRTYQGYGPWHIMYGLYLTYRAAFPKCVTEAWILQKMENDGGISALEKLDVNDLPGPLLGYGNKARAREFMRAKAILSSRSAA